MQKCFNSQKSPLPSFGIHSLSIFCISLPLSRLDSTFQAVPRQVTWEARDRPSGPRADCWHSPRSKGSTSTASLLTNDQVLGDDCWCIPARRTGADGEERDELLAERPDGARQRVEQPEVWRSQLHHKTIIISLPTMDDLPTILFQKCLQDDQVCRH